MIDITPYVPRFRQPPPFKHQLVGVSALVNRRAFFLGDAPRTCKSRQIIDAACILFDRGEIDAVVIICPVAARAVWTDRVLGQIAQYTWQPVRVFEFHGKERDVWISDDPSPKMLVVVTNYEFVKGDAHIERFCAALAGHRALLVFDESSAIANYKSLRSCSDAAAAAARIRALCPRVVMLNGTPGDPEKLWGQFNILDGVLSKRYSSYKTFEWRFGLWGAPETKEIIGRNGKVNWSKTVRSRIGWRNDRIGALSEMLRPYCLRRTRKDCPELRDIPILYDTRFVALTPETWRMYKQLRREAIIELSSGETYVSLNAGVRLMRLAQITSGYLGGFEEGAPVRDVSEEKLRFITEHLLRTSEAQNVIVWCRWVRERERLAELLRGVGFEVFELYGGQRRADRLAAEQIFIPATQRDPKRRYVMLAQPAAGGIALDMSAASEVYRLSYDYNLKTLEQSDDRPLGPAQAAPHVLYTDVLATGPEGQRTIDATIVGALRTKKDLARMTTAEWRTELADEEEGSGDEPQ